MGATNNHHRGGRGNPAAHAKPVIKEEVIEEVLPIVEDLEENLDEENLDEDNLLIDEEGDKKVDNFFNKKWNN